MLQKELKQIKRRTREEFDKLRQAVKKLHQAHSEVCGGEHLPGECPLVDKNRRH